MLERGCDPIYGMLGNPLPILRLYFFIYKTGLTILTLTPIVKENK